MGNSQNHWVVGGAGWARTRGGGAPQEVAWGPATWWGGRACHSTSSHFTEPLMGLVSWLVSLKGQSFEQPK